MSSLDGCYVILSVFLSKQKTAYERRISDWSSDVCSSDLPASRLSRYLATGPANEPAMFDTHLACAGKTQPRAIGLPSPKPPAGRSGAVSRGPTREPGVSEGTNRSEEHTSELQSLMRHSYAVFCLKKKKRKNPHLNTTITSTH